MDCEVIVAGGGPVGLMLACELRLAGVHVVVLERLREPDLTVKAGSVNAPTMEAFYRRGMFAPMKRAHDATMERFERFRPGASRGRPLGHYAGIMLRFDLLDAADPDFTDRGPVDGVG